MTDSRPKSDFMIAIYVDIYDDVFKFVNIIVSYLNRFSKVLGYYVNLLNLNNIINIFF